MTETSILQILIVLRPEAIRSLFLWHLFCDTGKVTGSGVCLSKWAFSVRGKWTDSAELLEKISGGDCLLPVGQGLKNDAKTMAILRSNPKQGISSPEATVWFSHYSVTSTFLLSLIGQKISFQAEVFSKILRLALIDAGSVVLWPRHSFRGKSLFTATESEIIGNYVEDGTVRWEGKMLINNPESSVPLIPTFSLVTEFSRD